MSSSSGGWRQSQWGFRRPSTISVSRGLPSPVVAMEAIYLLLSASGVPPGTLQQATTRRMRGMITPAATLNAPPLGELA
jgi:hypothetical protein